VRAGSCRDLVQLGSRVVGAGSRSVLIGTTGMTGAVRHQRSRPVRRGGAAVRDPGASMRVRAVPLRLGRGTERALDVGSAGGLPCPDAGQACDELLGARLSLTNSRPCPLVRTASVGHAQV
jgi:hypothetical protein